MTPDEMLFWKETMTNVGPNVGAVVLLGMFIRNWLTNLGKKVEGHATKLANHETRITVMESKAGVPASVVGDQTPVVSP